ncbi:mercuric reductase [Gloeobacter kilaueensis]|uniref:Mercuric reductase n=1 Tax=Gloeobacter kilaueensis (strain ATCC BAA-2537 / CCAP 1431/1 / ULC 316 / JS1) TaxID=1183438 RepID=U5QFN2_GLOK1|nr:mercuric reductase [Gloeobacter kilaueensis]AGY56485.1 mercuric reductase [Gloeobacter kilaueensis JS1]
MLEPPIDTYDRALIANVHPPDWVNPAPADRYNLVVIGGGTAGLVAAGGTALLGGKVALVERDLLGGDCLNTGCVPSKTLIRAARAAADVRDAHQYGVKVPAGSTVDFAAVMERLRRVRAEISPHDAAARFRDWGADVFLGEARFTGPEAVQVGAVQLRFQKAIVATGARPVRPRIEGLAEAGFLTSETVFSLRERPERLAVIGGGPLGCELAQAFARLGSQVVLLHRRSRLLDREAAEAAQIIEETFEQEGIRLLPGCEILRVERTADGRVIHYRTRAGTAQVTVDAILVGAGRTPNVEALDLEAAGVDYDREGVKVDDFLRTTNPRIYACGDVCLAQKFTHLADATARIAIQNALFLGRQRLSRLVIPRCTYTDPQVASVGLPYQEALEQGYAIQTLRVPLEEADRALTDGEVAGFAQVHLHQGSDRILGATIVAREAGEMISEITLAMVAGRGLGYLAKVIHPYPTQGEVIRKLADLYSMERLQRFRKLTGGWLSWLRRR